MDPLETLAKLEERVKKAEEQIPVLKQTLADSESNIKTQYDHIVELERKLQKYQALETALRDVFSVPLEVQWKQSGAAGTLEVHDPATVLGVNDPKEKLVVDSTTVIGQIGQAILEGLIVVKRMRVGEVEELLASHFNAKWGKGQVQMGLETLTAPPYRLFVHTIDPQRRHFFQLRETVKDRIAKE